MLQKKRAAAPAAIIVPKAAPKYPLVSPKHAKLGLVPVNPIQNDSESSSSSEISEEQASEDASSVQFGHITQTSNIEQKQSDHSSDSSSIENNRLGDFDELDQPQIKEPISSTVENINETNKNNDSATNNNNNVDIDKLAVNGANDNVTEDDKELIFGSEISSQRDCSVTVDSVTEDDKEDDSFFENLDNTQVLGFLRTSVYDLTKLVNTEAREQVRNYKYNSHTFYHMFEN